MIHSDSVVGKSLFATLHEGEDAAAGAVMNELSILLLRKEI